MSILSYKNEIKNCKRLKEAHKAVKLSQKSLGISAGMDEFSASARMNHYELGRHTPDYQTLNCIAKMLKLPVAYFYADMDELAELIKQFSNLKKTDKIAILRHIAKTE